MLTPLVCQEGADFNDNEGSHAKQAQHIHGSSQLAALGGEQLAQGQRNVLILPGRKEEKRTIWVCVGGSAEPTF